MIISEVLQMTSQCGDINSVFFVPLRDCVLCAVCCGALMFPHSQNSNTKFFLRVHQQAVCFAFKTPPNINTFGHNSFRVSGRLMTIITHLLIDTYLQF